MQAKVNLYQLKLAECLDDSNILQETQEYAESATELLNNYTDFETLVRNSQLKCGCTSIIDDYTTPDGNCQSVIYYIELLKRDITQNKSSHKFKNSVGATGQLSVNNICIDRLQVKFMGDNIEVDPQSKQKASTGIDFSVPNSSNIVLSINVLDEEKKLEKIDSVWKYLGGKVPEHQATFPITGAQLHEIFSGTSQERCDEVASIINKYSDEYGIDNAEKMSHFIGQIGAESNLNNLKEEYRYKKDRIKEVFGKVKYCDLFVGYESDLDECNGEKPASCIPQLTEITSNMVIKDKYKGSIKTFHFPQKISTNPFNFRSS